MGALKTIWGYLNQLQTNTALYKSLSELVTAKFEAPQLSIRAAKKWGIMNLSTSFHYDQIKELGNLFISGVISLEDFLSYSSSNMKVCDATYLKTERENSPLETRKRLAYIVPTLQVIAGAIDAPESV